MSRARDYGIGAHWAPTGQLNALTDVRGVRVGQVTLVDDWHGDAGDAATVRTGVTVILPHDGDPWREPVYAGFHRLNGCGEMTGVQWIEESGLLASPIALTSTHAVGAVHEGLVRWAGETRTAAERAIGLLPVVAETSDLILNDGFAFRVRPEHAIEAARSAKNGVIEEGGCGGGTGMICHGFKGGIGTSSRTTARDHGGYTVGVIVQANHGTRSRLTVDGVLVGPLISEKTYPPPGTELPLEGVGSVIGVIATDAPLLPHQCRRLAARAPLGVGRLGGLGEHGSGDLFLAFSTAERGIPIGYGRPSDPVRSKDVLSDELMNELFECVVEATEEAILNALVAARTMTGRGGTKVRALPAQEIAELLRFRR